MIAAVVLALISALSCSPPAAAGDVVDVKIREPSLSLAPDRSWLALSAVNGKPSRRASLQVHNPTAAAVAVDLGITGKDAGLFRASAAEKSIPAGGSITLTLEFTAPASAGRFSAGLQIGDPKGGTSVVLQGIGLAAFEGKNEPPLHSIVQALGIPLDVGGSLLELDTAKEVIGDSITARNFRPAGPGKIRITPLARFSPPGVTPFGIVRSGDSERVEIGRLADVSTAVPDAHQTLFPPLADGAAAVEFDAPSQAFAFYMQGHKFNSFSDPRIKTDATIPHTARVWPVGFFQGKMMRNSYLVGFEEASNGDYQDAVLLIENVAPAGD